MPRPMASCDFHSSWPASPGRTNASAISASALGGSGSRSGGNARREIISPEDLLLVRGFLGVAALELLDPARRIDDLLLAGIERVRLRRHLELDHGVLLAVLPLHGLAALGVDGRSGEEGVVGAGVEEDHRPVFGVDAVFHGARIIKENPENRGFQSLPPCFQSLPSRFSSRYRFTRAIGSRSGSTSRVMTPVALTRRKTRSRSARESAAAAWVTARSKLSTRPESDRARVDR